ncbi:MAG: SDR family oxidoreductase [Holophagales bacterium]|nr:MAG: SDR family oxidoreductase [Holophagales bacterium]
MRVLVTGHHGYIGSVLVPLFERAGHQVVGLDAGFFEACRFGAAEPHDDVRRRDLREVERTDLEGFDAIVHLGALSNDPLGDLDAELTYDINLHGSLRLARLAKEAGVPRFLFASSCSNYGASGGDAKLDEQATLAPITPYAISKVKLEAALLELADATFSPVMLRNATAYGVSPRLRVDIVLNNLVAWAVTTGRIVLQSDGTPWRPLVHVEDIGRAFLLLAGAPREAVHAEAFNIGGSEENYRIRELAEIVGETVPGCEIRLAEGAGPDPRNYRVSCAKLESRFPEFRLKWDARSGAAELAAAYRERGLDFAAFDGPRYKRLSRIRELIAGGEIGSDLRWRGSTERQ